MTEGLQVRSLAVAAQALMVTDLQQGVVNTSASRSATTNMVQNAALVADACRKQAAFVVLSACRPVPR
ncbi:MAG: hypothetical protein ACYCYO_16140 [Bacilli bacterium]